MNISYNWLKTYLNIDLTPQEVSKALTSIGLETGSIEEVQAIKGGLKGVVVGKVLTCVDHPNSDHLHVTTVDLGDNFVAPIVCGAANVAAGQHVLVATVGTVLYSGEESFTIKKSKIRGEESHGMICAEDELGIGTSHDGIMVLPDTAIPGTSAAEYLQLSSDYVLEVDITPNRVDAASHYGVARDLAAYLAQNGKPVLLQQPSVAEFSTDTTRQGVAVDVLNSEACPRYCGITIKGVTVAPSPEWLQQRLIAIGLRPINNIVDITNFILHETGQPLHCFDRAQIVGDRVVVRTVDEGTKMITLDGLERTLAVTDLMICNTQEPMCIAGVFGGLHSGVTDTTTDIFIESAYFSPVWVRKTARRHGLNTDSSFRFERGADPNNLIYVLKRAALMVQALAGGAAVGEIVDIYPTPINKFEVSLSYEKINTLVGKVIDPQTVKNILTSLEIEITDQTDTHLQLLVPTYRVDVQRDVDVIEEILRIYGYNNIAFTDSLHSNLSYQTATDRAYNTQNKVSEQLVGGGFNEILNNSLTKAAYYASSETLPESNCVMLLNPLSSDLNAMRQSLLFGGLESIAYNVNRRSADLRFFEFGNCYFYNSQADSENNTLAPYSEEHHLGLWVTGNRVSGSWAHGDEKSSVFELKAYLLNALTRVGIDIDKVRYKELPNDLFETSLTITSQNGRVLAVFGLVANKILKLFGIDYEVSFAEINWNNVLRETTKKKITYKEISKFPPVRRDLALLIDKNISFGEIEQLAYDCERKLLKEVTLFDVYEGKNLEHGKKSYAVSFLLQDDTKTLNEKQIEAIMNKLIATYTQKLGAKLR